MNWDNPTKLVQLTAALVAIPVALAGVFSFYHSQISAEGVCETLRSRVVATIDRNVPVEVKYALVHRDVDQFEKSCASIDPDTYTIFRVTIERLQLPAHHRSEQPVRAAASPQTAAGASASTPHAQPVAIFGLSTSGEQRGWVALSRRDAGHLGESNFDGFPDGQAAPPPVGARLHARRTIPVWFEPQIHGSDSSRLQGRLARGVCVEVLSAWAGAVRTWAEVAPVSCQEAANGRR